MEQCTNIRHTMSRGNHSVEKEVSALKKEGVGGREQEVGVGQNC